MGIVGHDENFAGMLAADEPHAALVGRDIIEAGGSAADAAIAMSFVMAVADPAKVGLGAGGSCLIYDRAAKTVEALDFVPPPTAGGALVPALPRGLYSLHAKYGRLHWAELLAPAERLARQGMTVSRAMERTLDVGNGGFADEETHEIFSRGDGSALKEGDTLNQLDLGVTIARMRVEGVGEFYSGAWAREILAAYNKAGATLTSADFSGYLPQWRTPIAVAYGNETAYFAPPRAAAGPLEAELWAGLAEGGLYAGTPEAGRPHLLAEAFVRGLSDRAQWMSPDGASRQPPEVLASARHAGPLFAGIAAGHQPAAAILPDETPAGSGIVAIDGNGSAVSCALGLNAPFGIGRVAPHTGIFPAVAADGQKGPYALGPMLAINGNSNEFRFAGAAGGLTAPTALIQVALATLLDGQPVAQAVAAPRLYAQPSPDAVLVEPGYKGVAALQAAGHQVVEAVSPARVNAIACGSGSPDKSRCGVAGDPRGAGLSITAGTK